MRKVALALLALAGTASAEWSVAFNFRSTLGYVTDPAGTTSVLATPYPTTRTVNGQVVTFGWEASSGYIYKADYRSNVDPRFAGVNCHSNNAIPGIFRVDLPATGQYDVQVGIGDMTYGQFHRVAIQSGVTQLGSIGGLTLPGQYFDALGTLLTHTTWAVSNTAIRKSFTSANLRVALGVTVDITSSCIAHLRIVQISPLRPAGSRSFSIQ